MEASRRRWWLRLETLVAVLVIAVASIDALLRLATAAVPAYRHQLADWVGGQLHARVGIGSLRLAWEGTAPALAATDVDWLDPDGRPRLRAMRVTLGFPWSRLVTGDLRPNKLALAGLSLRLQRQPDGSWRLPDLPLPQASDPQRLRRLVQAFAELRLRGCRVELDGVAPAPVKFAIDHLRLTRSAAGFSLTAELNPSAPSARRLLLRARLAGDLLAPSGWSGDWHVDLDGPESLPWLDAALGAAVGFADARVGLDGRLAGGRVQRLRLLASIGAVSARRDGRALATLLDVYASGEYLATTGGGSVRIDGVTAAGARGVWPRAGGRIVWQRGAGSASLDAQLDFLRLDDLAPWLALWPDAPRAVAALRQVRGDARRMVLRLERAPGGEPHWRLAAALDSAGWRDADGRGIDGLFGTLRIGDAGGEFHLADSSPELSWPGQLAAPLRFGHVTGKLVFSRGADGLQLATDGFVWAAAGISGSADARLELPDAGAAQLSLQLQLRAPQITTAEVALPQSLGAGLRRWLPRAIRRGRIDDARVQLEAQLGPQAPPARWNADLNLSGFDLDYAPGWPPLQNLAAKLHLDDGGLALDAGRASLAALTVNAIRGRIVGWQAPQLTVSGHLQGDAAQFYAALSGSPYHPRLAGLLDHTKASGPAALDVKLTVPLTAAGDVGAAGSVDVHDGRLTVTGVAQPFDAIAGQIQFGPQGLAASDLSGRWYGLPLTGAIGQAAGVPSLHLRFDAAPGADNGPAGAFVPAWLRAHLHGSAHWQVEMPLAGDDRVVTLTSDLIGVASDLPPPLGKPESAALPLTLRIDTGSPLGVDAVMAPQANPLALALRFADGGGLTGLALRLGTDVPPPVADGVRVDGRSQRLDLRSALALLRLLPDGGSLAFLGADIHADRLAFGRAVSDDVRLQLRAEPAAAGITAQWSGGIEGTLRWQDASRAVSGEFDHIALEALPTSNAPAGAASAGAPLDPRRAPTMNLRSRRVSIGGYDLGTLQLTSERIAQGQRLTGLSLSGGQAKFSATGTWTRSSGVSSAGAQFTLDSGHLGDLLQAFGFVRTLTAERARIDGTLTWPDVGDGLDLALAKGEIHLQLDHGVLRAVDPGAGRVLGLFNLYALPRRLTLNFHDVVGKGLSYDHIDGSFALGDGQAVTHDLTIAGPSLRISVDGRIGLAARDYDERVRVYPHVTTGVTLGAALATGPAAPIVAPLALLAQWLLNKPLDKITHLDYRVTGSWDNPTVTHSGAEPASAASTAGSAAKVKEHTDD
ncbi:MAG: TIGR02099 family protein [Gammaproteobacteria bacterium]|nr:TIGR02099 family protein [Gammaproteobacteria bacterium]